MTYIGDENHAPSSNEGEESFDLAVLLELATYIFAVRFILYYSTHQFVRSYHVNVAIGPGQKQRAVASPLQKLEGKTRLNVANEQSTAGAFSLNAFFDNRIMHFLVFLAALSTLFRMSISQAAIAVVTCII